MWCSIIRNIHKHGAYDSPSNEIYFKIVIEKRKLSDSSHLHMLTIILLPAMAHLMQ